MRNQIAEIKESIKRPRNNVDVLTLDIFEEFCRFMEKQSFGKWPSLLQHMLEKDKKMPANVTTALFQKANSDQFMEYIHNRIMEHVSKIDDGFILDVAEILEQSGGKVVRPQNKTVWRVLLVAAILISLFTATAYALDWFGLSARRISPDLPEETDSALSDADAETMARIRDTHRHSYVSLGGVTGSPEYSAAAEWLSWRAAHEEEMAAS